jgi:hypothetical protein
MANEKEQNQQRSQSRQQESKDQEQSQDQSQDQNGESAAQAQQSAALAALVQGVPEAGQSSPEVVELPVTPEDIAAAGTQVMEEHVDEPTGSRRKEVSQALWALDNDSRIEDRNGNSLLRPSASVTNLVSEES